MASIPVAQAREDVAVLFLSYLGRAPEFTAMNYYVGLYNQLLASQGDAAAAADNAFKALSAQIYVDAGNIGEIPAGPSVSDEEYVNWIYQNVLGRAADTDGLDYWLAQLGSGAIERADLVGIVVAAAGDDERDAAYLANRTEVALEFAKFENSNAQILGSLPFNAKQVLEGVNEDDATVAAAQAKLYSTTNGGESFTLTTGVDNLVGTSGDDVFNAVPVNPADSAAATTLNAFDTIDGGAGRDTLNIYTDAANNNTIQQGTIRNVEVINIYNADGASELFGQDAGVDASKFAGAEEVWQFTRANGVVNLAATTVAGFADLDDTAAVNVAAAAGVASAAVALKDVTTAANSALTVNVAGAALTSVTLTGELTDGQDEDDQDAFVNLSLTNSASKGDVTFTVNTAIDAVVTLAAGKDAKIVALDASASTGDIDFTVTSADLKSLKGGSGDDAFTFDRALTLTDSVDGGEGIDTVTLADQGTVLATQDYDAIANLQNIDILAFQTSNITVDASKLAFEQIGFDVADGGTVTVNKLGADQVLLITSQADEVSTALLTLNNAAADASLQLFDEGQDITLTIGARGEDVTGGTLAVSGEGSLSYSNTDAQFATIDVSELEGDFALSGLVGTVAETIVLGAGSTVIILDVGTPSSTVGLLDTITGFDATTTETDLVRDFLGGVNIQADAVSTTGLTDINQAWAKAAEAYDEADLAGNAVLLFQYEGDTYLYASNSDTAGRFDDSDFAIKLVGLYTVEQLDVGV